MPPKVKITKEEIVNAALEIVRKSGDQAINARTIASVLDCSTQPIFSNFATMDDLRLAVLEKANRLYEDFSNSEMASGTYPPYKASGMAYIRFAKEEKELFKFLFMRDRSAEAFRRESDFDRLVLDLVCHNTGLDTMGAQLFHLQMWACVHGIATMFATGFCDLEWELVSKMLSDAYHGHKKLYEME